MGYNPQGCKRVGHGLGTKQQQQKPYCLLTTTHLLISKWKKKVISSLSPRVVLSSVL